MARRPDYPRPGSKRGASPQMWGSRVAVGSYVSPGLRERLLAMSDEMDISVAEIIRRALMEWIENHNEDMATAHVSVAVNHDNEKEEVVMR